MSSKIKFTRKLVLFLVAVLIATSVPMTVYAKDAIGSKLQIEKIEGTAYIVNKKGTKIEARAGVKLSSGESVQTSAGSYVYISLDESKLVKLNELSQVQVNKSGKKLSLKVEEGELYFEVNEKLADDESMEFTASTMAMSVRGTAGIIGLRRVGDNIVSDVDLLDGRVDMIYSDITGVNHEFTMWGGESSSHIEGMPGLDRDLIDITEIAGFAAVEFANNPTLAAAILERSGLNSEYAISHSSELLADDQMFYQSNYGTVFVEGSETSVASLHPMVADIVVEETRVDKQLNKDIKKAQNGEATTTPEGEGIAPFVKETPAPLATPVVLPSVAPTVKPTATPYLDPNWNMPDEEPAPVWDGGGNDGSDSDSGSSDGGDQGGSSGGDSGGGGGSSTPTPAVTKCKVRFIDGYNGDVISEQIVESGGSATLPTVPEHEGYTFTGWTGDYANITRDTEVVAGYKENTVKRYTVTFYGQDLSILKKQTVDSGESATPPTAPTIDGYTFKSWDGNYQNVTTNRSVYAVYEAVTPAGETASVIFYMHQTGDENVDGDHSKYSYKYTKNTTVGTYYENLDKPTVSDFTDNTGKVWEFLEWKWYELDGDVVTKDTFAEARYIEKSTTQYNVTIGKRINNTVITIESYSADAGTGLRSKMDEIETTLRREGYTSFIWGASGPGANSNYETNLQGDIDLKVFCYN